MEMTAVDFVAHEMLCRPGSAEVMSSKDVWAWVRQKSKLRGANVVVVIKDALNKAFEHGLIEQVEESAKTRGRKVVLFKKRTWTDILSSGEEAREYAQQLLLTPDHFP